MNKQKFYDVYVSYPPGENRERINDCLRDNLPENEAEDLIQALAERSQAIIAENCSQDERENAQHYFNYLGLDVIVRQSMELTPNAKNEEEETTNKLHQCPVCRTIIDDQEATECSVCHFHFSTANEATIQRKRIEWEEKLAFEHKRQAEIEQKIQQEKEREEKQCEIYTDCPNDQLTARIFYAIPRIGEKEKQHAGRCRAQQYGSFRGKCIRDEAAHDRRHPCAKDGGGEAHEMLEIVVVPALRIQIGAQQDNACTDEESEHLPKDGDGKTTDEFMCPSLQLQNTYGDIHNNHPFCTSVNMHCLHQRIFCEAV
mgnify:CR=1 FL=1